MQETTNNASATYHAPNGQLVDSLCSSCVSKAKRSSLSSRLACRFSSSALVATVLFVACASGFRLLEMTPADLPYSDAKRRASERIHHALPLPTGGGHPSETDVGEEGAIPTEPFHATPTMNADEPSRSAAPASPQEGTTTRRSQWNAGPLRCYVTSSASFYDTNLGECREVHSVDDNGAFDAVADGALPPTDPTLVPALDAYALPSLSASPALSANSTPVIAERFAPSQHSRWLLEDWRLWEGELPCSNRAELRGLATPHTGIFANETDGRTSDPLPANVDPRHAPFVTRGSHRDRLPSSLYELENACIDEESGRLLAFAAPRRPLHRLPSRLCQRSRQ